MVSPAVWLTRGEEKAALLVLLLLVPCPVWPSHHSALQHGGETQCGVTVIWSPHGCHFQSVKEESREQPPQPTGQVIDALQVPLVIGKNNFKDNLLDFHQQLVEIVSRRGYPTENRIIMKIAKILVWSLSVMMSGFPILRNIWVKAKYRCALILIMIFLISCVQLF